MKKVMPYGGSENKTEEVRQMFDNISGQYDILNDVLSFGMGRRWRRQAVKKLTEGNSIPRNVLDVASGTGDFAFRLYDTLSGNVRITGIDISEKMLDRARVKCGSRKIDFVVANAENIPFEDCTFDALSCSYGVRNFDNPGKCLEEFYRVMNNSSRLVIVEISTPKRGILKSVYNLYFNKILPFIGGILSSDKQAYAYLPESAAAFPSGAEFAVMLEHAGFRNCSYKELFGGTAMLYFAEKL